MQPLHFSTPDGFSSSRWPSFLCLLIVSAILEAPYVGKPRTGFVFHVQRWQILLCFADGISLCTSDDIESVLWFIEFRPKIESEFQIWFFLLLFSFPSIKMIRKIWRGGAVFDFETRQLFLAKITFRRKLLSITMNFFLWLKSKNFVDWQATRGGNWMWHGKIYSWESLEWGFRSIYSCSYEITSKLSSSRN